MGYSIAAPCQSKVLRDKMLGLLKREYREWPVLRGHPERGSALRGPLSRGLSYHRGKCFIGFDYGPPPDGEREYAFSIVRWVALRIGCKNPEGLPYYVYDGHENIALLVDADHLDPEGATVDRWGVPIETPDARRVGGVWDRIFMMVRIEDGDMFPVIRAEIQRLDALWEKLP